MRSSSPLKAQLVQELGKLPEDRLREVLDFVEYLLWQEQKVQQAKLIQELEPSQDPLLKFIGGVSHGSLAQGIDQELYGK
jgi:hypothetical protein